MYCSQLCLRVQRLALGRRLPLVYEEIVLELELLHPASVRDVRMLDGYVQQISYRVTHGTEGCYPFGE